MKPLRVCRPHCGVLNSNPEHARSLTFLFLLPFGLRYKELCRKHISRQQSGSERVPERYGSRAIHQLREMQNFRRGYDEGVVAADTRECCVSTILQRSPARSYFPSVLKGSIHMYRNTNTAAKVRTRASAILRTREYQLHARGGNTRQQVGHALGIVGYAGKEKKQLDGCMYHRGTVCMHARPVFANPNRPPPAGCSTAPCRMNNRRVRHNITHPH